MAFDREKLRVRHDLGIPLEKTRLVWILTLPYHEPSPHHVNTGPTNSMTIQSGAKLIYMALLISRDEHVLKLLHLRTLLIDLCC